jgi:excisionase family DNA binding protein
MASYKPQLLTRKEASRYLNVSESTLDRITARKLLPTIRIGSLVRFKKEDLDDFINESY